jgi:hypothetical protein
MNYAQVLGRASIISALLSSATLHAQSAPSGTTREDINFAFANFEDIYGSRLVAAFDSIPAARYDYRPTPLQQSIGYIAQHLEGANYSLCERFGDLKHTWTAKDSLADSVKARWPKDTLVARLKASLAFCDTALARMVPLRSVVTAINLVGFETDLAEHYSQLAVYMRLLNIRPPTALQPRPRSAIDLPGSVLSQFVGVYQLTRGLEFDVRMREGALYASSSVGNPPRRLWPATDKDFFAKEVDVQVTFTRDANGAVTGLVLHQFKRDRFAAKIK